MKKTVLFLSTILIISLTVIYGCKDEVKDNDLIQGKWMPDPILKDTLASPCQKRSYIEFTDYVLEDDKRLQIKYHACLGEEEFEGENGTETRTIPAFSEKIGYYKISGDTLKIKSMNNITTVYSIKYITSDSMRLSSTDKDGFSRDTIYRRFKN